MRDLGEATSTQGWAAPGGSAARNIQLGRSRPPTFSKLICPECPAPLGPALTLEQLRKKLGLGPFPGNLELVVFVTCTTMSFTRTWPVTPSAAAALNRADLPGARSGVVAVELGAEPTVSPHGQYSYFLVISEAKVEKVAPSLTPSPLT